LYVVTGATTNLPIQMTGNLALLGLPGQRTRLDITLGVNANGNGIPDAWEHAFLAALQNIREVVGESIGQMVGGLGVYSGASARWSRARFKNCSFRKVRTFVRQGWTDQQQWAAS
jgi:hypothetical protein